MTNFPHLLGIHDYCDASPLLPLPYAIRIIWYPRPLKLQIAATQKRAMSLDAQGLRPLMSTGLQYLMRLRGRMHPYEYAFQGARQELLLADAYLEVGRRYEETLLQQARLFCFAAVARYARVEDVEHVEYVLQKVYGSPEADAGYHTLDYRVMGLTHYYMWAFFVRAHEDRQDFLDRLTRFYGYGN
jgi:hypothetical protein